MTTTPLSWTGRTWKIVQADVDLSHVFTPNDTISFVADSRGEINGYRVVHSGAGPAAECCHGTFLIPAGGQQQTLFQAVSDNNPLPTFIKNLPNEYESVTDRIASYTEANPPLPHLKGVLTIPCHTYPAQLQVNKLAEHSSKSIETPIHVYQFAADPDNEGTPLLVIRTPMTPECDVSGNGTVLGYD